MPCLIHLNLSVTSTTNPRQVSTVAEICMGRKICLNKNNHLSGWPRHLRCSHFPHTQHEHFDDASHRGFKGAPQIHLALLFYTHNMYTPFIIYEKCWHEEFATENPFKKMQILWLTTSRSMCCILWKMKGLRQNRYMRVCMKSTVRNMLNLGCSY